MSLNVNGTTYAVNITYGSMSRSFSAISGSNAGTMLDKSEYPDIVGTSLGYTFTIEPDPTNRAAYDRLVELLTTPNNQFTFYNMPYGQTTKTIVGRVQTMTDKYNGVSGGYKRWSGLSITIKPITPYKTV